MTTATPTGLTLPPGRLVQGSVYDPQTKDMQGKPLVVKSGPRMGQPTQRFYFAVAIPKGAETHWAYTEWGKVIWAFGHGQLPQLAARPDFAWKIDDGDSAEKNTTGRAPKDYEGFPGNWIVRMTSEFTPKCYVSDGSGGWRQLLDVSAIANAIKPGYYIEVALTLGANGDARNPGLYLNHSMVALRGFGPEINFGPNVQSAGFGQAPLPQGASAVPTAAAALPAVPGPASPPAPSVAAPPPAAVPVVPVTPHVGILAVPPGPGTAAPPPPAAPARVMTAKAAGMTYEAYIASGWTDVQLVQHGMMAP